MATNGNLPLSALRPATGGVQGSFAGSGMLAIPVAAAWNAAAVHIHTETGIWLTSNGPDSMYRSYARQVYWRNYWCGRGSCQNAAIPGSSNHGLGYAVDDSPTGYLLDRYGAPFGWRRSCSDAPWENWHWHWCGGWSGKDPGPYGKAGGHTPNRYPTLKRGAHGSAVKRAQRHLDRWNIGMHRPKVDGDFGLSTKLAVLDFQVVHDLHTDGTIGRKTWRELRLKDHFKADERLRLNRIQLLRHGHINAADQAKIEQAQKWCAHRAHAIANTAHDHGWADEHRKERFDRLKGIAGKYF